MTTSDRTSRLCAQEVPAAAGRMAAQLAALSRPRARSSHSQQANHERTQKVVEPTLKVMYHSKIQKALYPP